jgi:hypothetical protein
VRLNDWVDRLDLAHHALAATREHLDPLSDDLGLPVAPAALVVPRARLQAALDRHELPLAEVAAGDLGEAIPDDDGVVLNPLSAADGVRCRNGERRHSEIRRKSSVCRSPAV